MEIIYLIIGLVVGFITAWLIASFKFKSDKGIPLEEAQQLNEQINAFKVEISKLTERNKLLEEDKQSLQMELKAERTKSERLNSDYSSLKSDNSNLQQKLTEQKTEIEKLQEKFTKEFENLANRIFEEKTTKFSEQSKNNLQDIIKPLRDEISKFEKKIDETSKESIRGNASLKEQLQSLKDMNQQITQEAKNLTQALKGQTRTQGNWGEFILVSILEKSGLVKGNQYIVQESITSESGKRYQPDVIIKLPDNKSIVIDSKVSLNAYERFISSDDDHQRQLALREHINSIRSHVKNLSSKNYQNLYQLESLDFVLMFMPIEPAFSLSVQNDQSIFNDAFEKNIVIVSPSTLLATLRTIESIWRQEKQNRNVLEIARQSGDMLDKFYAFVEDLAAVGKGLDSAKDTYDKAWNKLKDGRGNLISRAEKIKSLGAKTTKSPPQQLLDKANDEVDEIDEKQNSLFHDDNMK